MAIGDHGEPYRRDVEELGLRRGIMYVPAYMERGYSDEESPEQLAAAAEMYLENLD